MKIIYLNDKTSKMITVDDFRNTEAQYAKKNIDGITLKQQVAFVFDTDVVTVDKTNISHPVLIKEPKITESETSEEDAPELVEEKKEKEETSFEQISIFDDLD